jgi:hypothetical protein
MMRNSRTVNLARPDAAIETSSLEPFRGGIRVTAGCVANLCWPERGPPLTAGALIALGAALIFVMGR